MYLNYVIRRFIVLLVVIVLAISINFLIPRLMPGDPVQQKLAQLSAGGGGQIGDITEIAESYREKFGLDQPIWNQYLNYWWDLLHFDLGYSLANYPERVSHTLLAGLPWTAVLLGTSVLISFTIGTLLGGLLAWPRVPQVVRGAIPILMILSAIPYFILGIVFIFLFAILLKWLPAGGGYAFGTVLRFDFATMKVVLRHAALPILSIVTAGIGTWALGMRGMIISVLGEDYIDLAEAKGLKGRRIFFWYGMRNAMLPQVTRLALTLGYMVSGTILVEVVFAYPGLGYKLFQAIQSNDYFMIHGIVLLLILSIAAAMFILDLVYPLIDPRIAYERR